MEIGDARVKGFLDWCGKRSPDRAWAECPYATSLLWIAEKVGVNIEDISIKVACEKPENYANFVRDKIPWRVVNGLLVKAYPERGVYVAWGDGVHNATGIKWVEILDDGRRKMPVFLSDDIGIVSYPRLKSGASWFAEKGLMATLGIGLSFSHGFPSEAPLSPGVDSLHSAGMFPSVNFVGGVAF